MEITEHNCHSQIGRVPWIGWGGGWWMGEVDFIYAFKLSSIIKLLDLERYWAILGFRVDYVSENFDSLCLGYTKWQTTPAIHTYIHTYIHTCHAMPYHTIPYHTILDSIHAHLSRWQLAETILGAGCCGSCLCPSARLWCLSIYLYVCLSVCLSVRGGGKGGVGMLSVWLCACVCLMFGR